MGGGGVLVVSGCDMVRSFVKDVLEREGGLAFIASSVGSAWRIFCRRRPGACVADIYASNSRVSGLRLLERIKALDDGVFCLALAKIEDIGREEELRLAGADHVFIKHHHSVKSFIDVISNGSFLRRSVF